MAPSITKMRAALFAVAVSCVASSAAFACGLNWDMPQSHFLGVSFQGYVFHVENLGEIDLGNGLVLPLRAIFRSESNASSPYAGQGWDIPLLESHIVQINDRDFRMVEPTGWFRLFWRDGKDPSLLHGQNGWKAEIKGNTITAWADCGSKLVFNAGKITQLQLENRTFDYQYSGNGVSEIREGGKVVLKVEGEGLSFGGQEIWFELGGKPRVQVIKEQNVIAAVDHSLSKVRVSDGTIKSFEFAVNDKMEPTLKVKDDRLIVWDPATRRIKQDGEWTYEVKVGEECPNAEIKRQNAKNQTEYWFDDVSKGIETVQGLDGVKKITTSFVRGALAGRIRKKEEVFEGKTKTMYQATFDDKGHLLRETLEDGSVNEYVYSPDGKKVTQTTLKDGNPDYVISFGEYDRIDTVRSADGRVIQYFYDDAGRETKMIVNGKLHSTKSYDPKGAWFQIDVYSLKDGSKERSFYTQFDDKQRTALEVISKLGSDYPPTIKQYFYDLAGRLEKEINSREGTILYYEGPDGEQLSQLVEEYTEQ